MGSSQPKNAMTDSTRSFYFFAFTFRYFSFGRGERANCEHDVLQT